MVFRPVATLLLIAALTVCATSARAESNDSHLIRALTGHRGLVQNVAISPDGQTIVSGRDDETVRVWRMPDALSRASQGR